MITFRQRYEIKSEYETSFSCEIYTLKVSTDQTQPLHSRELAEYHITRSTQALGATPSQSHYKSFPEPHHSTQSCSIHLQTTTLPSRAHMENHFHT